MRFIKDYNTEKYSFLNIDNLLEEYGIYFIIESKIGDWIIEAPKVRKAQELANAKRYQAITMESKQRKEIDVAKAKGQDVDISRMWELLQNKLDALEDMAKEYDQEGIDAAGSNEYLKKVRRVTRLKGVIAVNNEKIADAEREERRELQRKNNEYKVVVQSESKEISDKIKEDKKKMAELKKKQNEPGYFQAQKAAQMRKNG
jgi:hypothetical protein